MEGVWDFVSCEEDCWHCEELAVDGMFNVRC